MLTEYEKDQALERVRDCGWAYEHANDGYRYVAEL